LASIDVNLSAQTSSPGRSRVTPAPTDPTEDELGHIAPDMLADVVVLSDDPREVRPAALEGIDVAMVFVGGILKVCATGYEARCPGPLPG
jgi:hypothetical protein